jgi:hypothetical protein
VAGIRLLPPFDSKFLVTLTKRTTVEKSEAVRIAQKAGLDVRAAFMDVFILFIFFLSFKFFYFQTKKRQPNIIGGTHSLSI